MNQPARTSRTGDSLGTALTLQRLSDGAHALGCRSMGEPASFPGAQVVSLVLAARDDERRRLARDLHDGLQQDLVVLRMRLSLLSERDEISPSELSPSPVKAWGELARDVDQMIGRLRNLANAVFPPSLIDHGLTAALRSYLARIPLEFELSCDPDPLPRLSPEIEVSAYFLVSEAVTNALKHARASRIEISVRLDGDGLEISVTDDGRGFESGQEGQGGRGLKNMAERVNGLGGHLQLSSEPGSGTEVHAWFPTGRVEAGAEGPAGTGSGHEQVGGVSTLPRR
ncbi:MAG: sensor histidine kinase [Actinomycetota bacterium]